MSYWQSYILYVQGKNSSDEEDLNDVPDDDEYDTEDSFIDDADLVSEATLSLCISEFQSIVKIHYIYCSPSLVLLHLDRK